MIVKNRESLLFVGSILMSFEPLLCTKKVRIFTDVSLDTMNIYLSFSYISFHNSLFSNVTVVVYLF